MRPSKHWTYVQVWCLVAPSGAMALQQPTTSHSAQQPDAPALPEKSLVVPHTIDASSLDPADSFVNADGPESPAIGTLSDPEMGLTIPEIPEPPNFMGWIGSIGGLLGIISFVVSWGERAIRAIIRARRSPKPGDPDWIPPSWTVAVSVGLDTRGHQSYLEGAGGDFPQVCVWDDGGKLLGWSDQKFLLQRNQMKKNHDASKKEKHGHGRYKHPRPDGMPYIESGEFNAVGIWPNGDKKRQSSKQAAYVTLVKRHFDAICVSGVHVNWPDQTTWSFDGSWGRASNVSWYHSNTFQNTGRPQECFWLDHRGNLDSTADKDEEYIAKTVKKIGTVGDIKAKYWPKWLWASDVVDEIGLPSGDELTAGMKEKGVDRGVTPLGVKIFLPGFSSAAYVGGGDGKDGGVLKNWTVDGFASNPARVRWLDRDMRQDLDHPLYPIYEPGVDFTKDDAPLLWEDLNNQEIPVDCLTDWYTDRNGKHVSPIDGDRCMYTNGLVLPFRKHHCKGKRSVTEPISPGVPLHQRFTRSLVLDTTAREGTGTERLCKDPNSVGPSYANRHERLFCRMTDKTLWPFCEHAKALSVNCFDADAEVLVEKNVPIGKRDVHWDLIEDWHSTGNVKRALGGDGEYITL